jgi:hypothetical protein
MIIAESYPPEGGGFNLGKGRINGYGAMSPTIKRLIAVYYYERFR